MAQDVATEILDKMEPSKPLGYRLVILRSPECWERREYGVEDDVVIFEAKAVPFKGGIGFLVRYDLRQSTFQSKSPKERFEMGVELSTAFAPSEEALKFLMRQTVESRYMETLHIILMPPGVAGHSRERGNGSIEVGSLNLTYGGGGVFNHGLKLDEHDSKQERALREAISALTIMYVPDNAYLKFESIS